MLLAFILIGACDKLPAEEAGDVLYKRILTNDSSKAWRYTSYTYRGSMEGIQPTAPCDSDNVYVFRADGTFSFYENTSCDGLQDGRVEEGVFELKNHYEVILLKVREGETEVVRRLDVLGITRESMTLIDVADDRLYSRFYHPQQPTP